MSGLDGERGRNRTFNLLIKSQLLCQLSYAPLNSLGAESITYADYTVPYRTRPMHAVPAKFPTCVTKSCEEGWERLSNLSIAEVPSVFEMDWGCPLS